MSDAGPVDEAPAPDAGDAAAPRRPSEVSRRRRTRELVLQGLYEWRLGGADAGVVDAHVREHGDFAKADTEFFDRLLHGCIAEAAAIDERLARHVDRPMSQVSPIEHGVLAIGTWELLHAIETPWRVVLNEGVELAKRFGGTDGHKFVNGVLDRVARETRTVEVEAAEKRKRR